MSQRPPYLLPRPDIERDFDVLFVDTEFSRLPLPSESVYAWATQAVLLSVGVACLDPSVSTPGLYAVRRPIDRKLRERCSGFVRSDVLPHLDAATPSGQFHTTAELEKLLRIFLSDRRRATGKPPAIAVDWPGDAILLGDVLPPGIEVLLLEGMLSIARAMETFFTGDYQRHNAYHDALALRQGFIDFLANSGECKPD